MGGSAEDYYDNEHPEIQTGEEQGQPPERLNSVDGYDSLGSDSLSESFEEAEELVAGLGLGDEHHKRSDLSEIDAYDQLDIGKVDILRRREFFKAMLHKLGRHLLPKDKFAFVLGSTCLWACSFWLGNSPQSFYRLYSALGIVLFGFRYFTFRARKWHYYLFDLCYYANFILVIFLWALPRSQMLAQVTFAFNAGPLSFTILAFRNSLVYHDMDRVTSVFMHVVPACVSWAIRWFPDEARFGPRKPEFEVNLYDLVVVPMYFYLAWALTYSLYIYWLAADRIKRRGYTTLFTYVISLLQKKGQMQYLQRKVPYEKQPIVYQLVHMVITTLSMLICAVPCWYSFVIHSIMLIGWTSASIYQGGCFYFEVFARRYHLDLSKPSHSHSGNAPASQAGHQKLAADHAGKKD